MHAQVVDSRIGTDRDGVVQYIVTFLGRFKQFPDSSSLKSFDVLMPSEDVYNVFSSQAGGVFDIDVLFDAPKYNSPLHPKFDASKSKPKDGAYL